MARLTRFSLLSLPGSWSGPHRLWARRIPGEPGKFRTLAQVRARLGDDCKAAPIGLLRRRASASHNGAICVPPLGPACQPMTLTFSAWGPYLLRFRQFNGCGPLISADKCQADAGGAAGVKTGRRPPRRGVVLTLAAAGARWAIGAGEGWVRSWVPPGQACGFG